MSEQTTDPAPAPPEGEPEVFDAEYVAKLRKEAAEYRTKAKANADAAERLAKLEEANKTEAEKMADRIRQLEDEKATAERDALRFKVASKFGIGDEDTDLFLTGSDEETLTKQAERLTARTDERKKQNNHVPKEGTTPREPQQDEMRAYTRGLFQKAD